MSSLIVLSLRVFGMPDGAGEVLVMAVALGLILAVALWRPTRRRHAVGSVDAEPRCGGRRSPGLGGGLSGGGRAVGGCGRGRAGAGGRVVGVGAGDGGGARGRSAVGGRPPPGQGR